MYTTSLIEKKQTHVTKNVIFFHGFIPSTIQFHPQFHSDKENPLGQVLSTPNGKQTNIHTPFCYRFQANVESDIKLYDFLQYNAAYTVTVVGIFASTYVYRCGRVACLCMRGLKNIDSMHNIIHLTFNQRIVSNFNDCSLILLRRVVCLIIHQLAKKYFNNLDLRRLLR